ncbi:MAG TPA: hypothetical protein VKU79_07545 [Thermoplasmataceae archaeon]|nr:hypothetical protein [Thermoplasmataceae archaeon]
MSVKLCPHCGSKNVNWIIGGIMGYIYTCQDCGYQGPFVVEVDAQKADEFADEINKSFRGDESP